MTTVIKHGTATCPNCDTKLVYETKEEATGEDRVRGLIPGAYRSWVASHSTWVTSATVFDGERTVLVGENEVARVIERSEFLPLKLPCF